MPNHTNSNSHFGQNFAIKSVLQNGPTTEGKSYDPHLTAPATKLR